MKVLTIAHKYELDSFEGTAPQVLQFIEKDKNENGEFVTLNDGTTNEEVLRMLIDRTMQLNHKFPCIENTKAIEHMELALNYFEERTAKRKQQNVEGKPLPHKEN